MQSTLFDIIEDVTGVKLCEICKEPSNEVICSKKCLNKLREIIKQHLKTKEDENNRKD